MLAKFSHLKRYAFSEGGYMGTELAKEELQDQYISMTDTVHEMLLLVEQMKKNNMELLSNVALETLSMRIENEREDLNELELFLNNLSQGLLVWEKLRELLTKQYSYAELRKIYDQAMMEIVEKKVR